MKPFYSNDKCIYIDIKDGYAVFYLESRVRYFKERQDWLEENNIGIDEDEPTEPESFYDIPLNQWNDVKYNWKNHMEEKTWFTKEMKNYLDNEAK